MTKAAAIVGWVFAGVGTAGAGLGAAAAVVTTQKAKDANKTYTIRFETNDGSKVADQKVKVNEKGIEPASPKKTGYQFIGWYTDAEFQNKYDWTAPVTGDITLYAHYKLTETEEQVTLTFDLGEGTLVSGELSRLVLAGTELGAINVPNFTAPAGKVFDGWNLPSTTKITESTTVYAQYIDAPTEDVYHTINFCIDGTETFDESSGGKLQLTVKDGTTWAEVMAREDFPTITNTGYVIGSYYIPALTGDPTEAIILENTTKITKGDGKSYIFNVNIHWKVDGAETAWLVFTDLSSTQKLSWTGTQSVEADITKTWSEASTGIKVQQEDSEFTNWVINNKDIDETTYSSITLKEVLDYAYGEGQWPECVIVQPKFNLNPVYYNVTFKNNQTAKGSITGTTKITASATKLWKNINKPQVVTNNGYSFIGWYNTSTGTLVSDTSKLTSDITVEAKWQISLESCMKIYAYEDTTIKFSDTTSYVPSLEYTDDDGNSWNAFTKDSSIYAREETTIYIRASAENRTTWQGYTNIQFNDGTIYLGGSIMGLLSKENVISEISEVYQFQNLFMDSTAQIYVSENFLPAKTLSEGCYYGLFTQCTNLIKAPELPATNLSKACYRGMFYGCTNLTYAPSVLPSWDAPEQAYEYMFFQCTALSTPPVLQLRVIEENGCDHMFYGCHSLEIVEDSTEATRFTDQIQSIDTGGVEEMFSDTKGHLSQKYEPTTNKYYYYK